MYMRQLVKPNLASSRCHLLFSKESEGEVVSFSMFKDATLAPW